MDARTEAFVRFFAAVALVVLGVLKAIDDVWDTAALLWIAAALWYGGPVAALRR